jgi:hypothetical protein
MSDKGGALGALDDSVMRLNARLERLSDNLERAGELHTKTHEMAERSRALFWAAAQDDGTVQARRKWQEKIDTQVE